MMNQTNPHCVELLSDTMETLVNRISIIPARYGFKNNFMIMSFLSLLFTLYSYSLHLSLSLSLSHSLSLSLSLSLSRLRAVCEVVLSEISTSNLMTWRQGLTLIHNIIGAVDYKVIIDILLVLFIIIIIVVVVVYCYCFLGLS